MSLIAIIGAGPIGSTLAHKLAGRDRIAEIRLIDTEVRIAQGKALDIQQSGAVENFSTRLFGVESLHATAGADVIVVADAAANGAEHTGESGLSLLRNLNAAGVSAPFVFAG